jgi:hypothetical protein
VADLRARLLGWIARIEGKSPKIIATADQWPRQMRLDYRALAEEYASDKSMGMPPGD